MISHLESEINEGEVDAGGVRRLVLDAGVVAREDADGAGQGIPKRHDNT